VKKKELWLWFAVGFIGGPVALWGAFALLNHIPAIAELLDAFFQEYWPEAVALGTAASFLYSAVWLSRVRKHGWFMAMDLRGKWLMVWCVVPWYGAMYYLSCTAQGALSMRAALEVVWGWRQAIDENLEWIGWVGLLVLPIVIFGVLAILVLVLRVWAVARTQSRRTVAVEAARKPLPKTDPEQMSLFKAGLIE
jgi:hypothetical protein